MIRRKKSSRTKPTSTTSTTLSTTRNRKQILSQTNHQLCRSTLSGRNAKRRDSDNSTDCAVSLLNNDAGGVGSNSQKENQSYHVNSQTITKTRRRKSKIEARNTANAARWSSSYESSHNKKKKKVKEDSWYGDTKFGSRKVKGRDYNKEMHDEKIIKGTIDTADASSIESSLVEDDGDDSVSGEEDSHVASREYDFCFGDSLISELELSTCSKDDCKSFVANHQRQQHNTTEPNNQSDDNIQRSILMADHQYFRELDSKLRTLFSEACTALKMSNMDEALVAFEEILNIVVDEYGTSHKRVATALQNLSMVHQRAGNLEEALDCIETAIKIRKKKLGKYHLKVADALSEMGIILMAKEEYEDSLEILNEALSLCERELSHLPEEECGKVKLQIAKILNDIGCVSFEYGEMNDAKDAFEQSLRVQKDCYELKGSRSMPGFLATSTTICNQGFVAMASADFETAIEKLEDALKIQRNVLEPTSVTIMTTINHLAYAYLKYGGINKSLEQYQILVEIIKERHDANHYHRMLSETLRNKAYCELKLFEFDKATRTLKKLQNILMETDEDPAHVPIKDEDIQHLISNIKGHESKMPSLCEYVSKTLTTSGYRNPWDTDLLCKCGYDIDDDNDMNLEIISPKCPLLRSYLYGHKVCFP